MKLYMKFILDSYRILWFVSKNQFIFFNVCIEIDSFVIYMHVCNSPQSLDASALLLSGLLVFVVKTGRG